MTIPAGKQASRGRAAGLLGLLLSLAGCERAPVQVPVENLAFPVVLITSREISGERYCRAQFIHDREDLALMPVWQYLEVTSRAISDPPIVIDLGSRSYTMDKIVGGHGTLWMMINPTGLMPLQFVLMSRKDGGIENARGLIGACRYLGRNADPEVNKNRQEQVLAAQDMQAILDILNGNADPPPEPKEEAEPRRAPARKR